MFYNFDYIPPNPVTELSEIIQGLSFVNNNNKAKSNQMFGSSMLEIIIEMATVIISLIILFLIGRAIILKVKKSLEFKSRQRKNLTKEKKLNKMVKHRITLLLHSKS